MSDTEYNKTKDDYDIDYNDHHTNDYDDEIEDDEIEDDECNIFDIICDLKKDLQDYFFKNNPNIGENLKYQDLFDFVNDLREC